MQREVVQEIFARNEEKYLLTTEQKEKLIEKIKEHIKHDPVHPYSQTSSLYYDTENFKLARTCLERPEYRKKIRVRTYGKLKDSSLVFMEQKIKFDGVTYKRRQEMPYLTFKNKGKVDSQIFKELDYQIENEHLEPKFLINYSRESFVGDNDLRITFDNNIKYSALGKLGAAANETILDENLNILEIKTLYAIPMWLGKALNELKIYPTSYSKYVNVYKKENGLC